MIAHITYTCIGSEPQSILEDGLGFYIEDGLGGLIAASGTTLNFAPVSGYTFIDVILNGYSQDFNTEVTVDNFTGNVIFNQILVRGDWVLVLFRQLPRLDYAPDVPGDFDAVDFPSSDFFV